MVFVWKNKQSKTEPKNNSDFLCIDSWESYPGPRISRTTVALYLLAMSSSFPLPPLELKPEENICIDVLG